MESTEDAISVYALGELIEVHIGDEQVGRNTLHLPRNDMKDALRLIREVQDENGMFHVCQGDAVNDEQTTAVGMTLAQGGQGIDVEPLEIGIADNRSF